MIGCVIHLISLLAIAKALFCTESWRQSSKKTIKNLRLL